jgi:hypothetical protein
MSLRELRAYPSAKARGFLKKSGMQEVQVDKVMAAHGSLLAATAPAAVASNPFAAMLWESKHAHPKTMACGRHWHDPSSLLKNGFYTQ